MNGNSFPAAKRVRIVTQYAYALAGQRIGPWRTKRRAAVLDALRGGNATRDRNSGRVYIIVPADIVTRCVEPTMVVEATNVVPLRRRPVLRLVS